MRINRSDFIIFSKNVVQNFVTSLQEAGRWVGECEIDYNVYKFMKIESKVGITVTHSQVQMRDAEATPVSRRTICRLFKEGENVETGVAMAFSFPSNLRQQSFH